jgi:hypothetical protein
MTNYTYVNNSLTNLTKALVLHPVAAGESVFALGITLRPGLMAQSHTFTFQTL